MNFIVKPYDPLEEALQLFEQHNQTPANEREHTEEELISLVVHKVKTHERSKSTV
jgi:hypothetical protein